MRRSIAVVFSLLICLGALPSFAAAESPARKVLFIGIDGCRFDALQAADAPNLDRLIAEGAVDPDCQILGERYQKNDTISGPGWSSILCGVWADKHGVHDNSFNGRNYDAFPHFFTRLKEVRPEAFTASVATWVPIQDFIVRDANIGLKFTPPENDYVIADKDAAAAACKILTENDPTVLFYYIGQVDETGHKKGFHPTVKEYTDAIHQADIHVGEVLAALHARPKFAEEQWLILVTSDHGGKGLGHGGGHNDPEIRNSFLIIHGAAAKPGRIEGETYLVDAPVTALGYLGVEAKPEWQLDGRVVGLK
ncbi:MAG: alkaline phosphatase family protein [Pirellulales bacterium]|nr:alkaline phosphatase family protein [Pirellulales bacterium]